MSICYKSFSKQICRENHCPNKMCGTEMYFCQIPCASTTFLPFLFSGALRRKGEADCTDSSSQLVPVSLQFLLGKQELSTFGGGGGSDKIDWNKKEEEEGVEGGGGGRPHPPFPQRGKEQSLQLSPG